MKRWLEKHRRGLLTLIIGASVCQALLWVFLVPIFQSPDEPAHLDYALHIAECKSLIRPETVPRVPYRNGWFECSHAYTRYLLDRTETSFIAFNPAAKVAPEYGSAAYFAALEREAPAFETVPDSAPLLAIAYPWGYYAVLAGWIELLRCFTNSVVLIFFGARILSVVLLSASLVLVYAICKELGLPVLVCLAMTAGIGLFPLTSFVSSYVQPDNLSFFLVLLNCALALRLRRRAGPSACLLLGSTLGCLLMTKAHHFVCVLVPVLALAAIHARSWQGSVGRVTLLLLPSIALVALFHPWTAWGLGYYQREMLGGTRGSTLAALDALKRALLDFYSGTTHESFWGRFGWMDTPLVFGSRRTNAIVQYVLGGTAWLLLGLTLWRLEQVASRLTRLAWNGRPRLALRLACSNPALNGYFLFTILMIVLFVRSNNYFSAQGRNWYPFLLPVFLTAVVYAPRAMTLRTSRRLLQAGLMIGLLAYACVGSGHALRTIQKRFYPKLPGRALVEERLLLAPVDQQQITWSEGSGEGSGTDPSLVFRLDRTEPIVGVRVRISVMHASELPVFFQAYWKDAAREEFCEQARTAVYYLLPSPEVKTVTIWVHGAVSHLRLDPDIQPCQYTISEITLLR